MRSFHGYFLPGFSSFGQAVSEKIFFRNLPTRNKNCIWQPSLLTDQNKRTNLNRGPSIDTSYQVLVHLAKRFQRRRFKCEKLTDDGHKVMAKAHMAFRPGELKITNNWIPNWPIIIWNQFVLTEGQNMCCDQAIRTISTFYLLPLSLMHCTLVWQMLYFPQ